MPGLRTIHCRRMTLRGLASCDQCHQMVQINASLSHRTQAVAQFRVPLEFLRRNQPQVENSLANSPQARKRARQAEKRRVQNASQRSMVRTYIKRVDAAIAASDAASAANALEEAVPMIDRMVSKGIMHKNKAARHKSRLNRKIQALS